MKVSNRNSSSGSDSDDEEEARRLVQAVDPDFMKSPGKKEPERKHQVINSDIVSDDIPVSKRPRIKEDDFESLKPYSLVVTADGQKFIAKKLTQSLDKTLKEVDPPPPSSPAISASANLGIRLFSTSQSNITESDLTEKRVQRKFQKRKKRKRKMETEASTSESSSDSDNEKLRSVAVTADWVLSKD